MRIQRAHALVLVVSTCIVTMVCTGCASSLSTMQPATVVPRGRWHGVAALNGSLPVGSVRRSYDIAKSAAAGVSDGGTISDADRDRFIDATVGLMLNAPAVGSEFQIGYGVYRRTEIDLRWALSSLRLGARYQLLGSSEGKGFAITIGTGLSRYVRELPVPDALEQVVGKEDFTRWEIDVPLLFGWSHEWFHVWFGPKFIYSTFDASLGVCMVVDASTRSCNRRISASLDGSAMFFGGQAGVAVGYRYAWVAFELTTAGMISRADGVISDGTSSIRRTFDPSDLVLFPTLGVILRI